MDGYWYFYFIAILGVLYGLLVRLIRNKLIDIKAMKEFQEESKRLTEEMKKAQRANDRKRVNEILEEQAKLMPKLNTMMFGQMKMMVVVIVIFLAFMYVGEMFDPYKEDDFVVELNGNCSYLNYSFVGCFKIENGREGVWYATIKGYDESGNLIGSRDIAFFVEKKEDDSLLWEHGKNIEGDSDKDFYRKNDKVIIYAFGENLAKAEAVVNNGTRFYVDLPFTIPLLNVRRIYDSRGWFILSTFIFGSLMSYGANWLEKNFNGVFK